MRFVLGFGDYTIRHQELRLQDMYFTHITAAASTDSFNRQLQQQIWRGLNDRNTKGSECSRELAVVPGLREVEMGKANT